MLENPSSLPMETPQPTTSGCCGSVTGPSSHPLPKTQRSVTQPKGELPPCLPALFPQSKRLAPEAGLKQKTAHRQPTAKPESTVLLTGPMGE